MHKYYPFVVVVALICVAALLLFLAFMVPDYRDLLAGVSSGVMAAALGLAVVYHCTKPREGRVADQQPGP